MTAEDSRGLVSTLLEEFTSFSSIIKDVERHIALGSGEVADYRERSEKADEFLKTLLDMQKRTGDRFKHIYHEVRKFHIAYDLFMD